MDISIVKAVGNLQTSYMYWVEIPIIPLRSGNVTGEEKNFTATARTTKLLDKTRTTTNFRFLSHHASLRSPFLLAI